MCLQFFRASFQELHRLQVYWGLFKDDGLGARIASGILRMSDVYSFNPAPVAFELPLRQEGRGTIE